MVGKRLDVVIWLGHLSFCYSAKVDFQSVSTEQQVRPKAYMRSTQEVVLDKLRVLSRPLRKRAMNVVMSLVDTLPGRVVDQVVTFHLLQPVPFAPVAPDQDLARVCQVTPKKISTDIQETMPISLPTTPGLSI